MDLERMYYETPYVEIQEVLLPFVLAYRSHDPIPEFSKDERLEVKSHCNIKGLVEDTEYM